MGENVDAYRPAFTPTEMRVLRLYANGLSWDQMTYEMRIARSTLSEHWARIMAKTPEAASHIDVLRVIGWLNVPIDEAVSAA
jgi:DNA-binding NarL/FixJ family response regulator